MQKCPFRTITNTTTKNNNDNNINNFICEQIKLNDTSQQTYVNNI